MNDACNIYDVICVATFCLFSLKVVAMVLRDVEKGDKKKYERVNQ